MAGVTVRLQLTIDEYRQVSGLKAAADAAVAAAQAASDRYERVRLSLRGRPEELATHPDTLAYREAIDAAGLALDELDRYERELVDRHRSRQPRQLALELA